MARNTGARAKLRAAVAARSVAVRRAQLSARLQAFDYVNPRAPKAGVVRLVALGTFDNFNQVVAGLKGLFAAAAGTICDTLMASSLDEASAYYGLIAEPVSHPSNFASTSFRLRAAADTTTASRFRSRT